MSRREGARPEVECCEPAQLGSRTWRLRAVGVGGSGHLGAGGGPRSVPSGHSFIWEEEMAPETVVVTAALQRKCSTLQEHTLQSG